MAAQRFYSFVNRLYMSPIQLGIQTAHGVSSMMCKTQLDPDPAGNELVLQWAMESPTIMVCDGGNVASLLSIEARVGSLAPRLGLPWASFREDEQSLAGAITQVGVLVPDRVFCLRGEANAAGGVDFVARDGAEADFSGIEGGLPLTAESNPALHELASLVALARLA